jgi:hypothetical protein
MVTAVEKGSNNFSHSVTVSEDIKTKKNAGSAE